MPNSFKFSRTLASVLATVALVSSALTGLLYSSPVNAAGNSTSTATNPTPGSKFVAGRARTFSFTVTNTSGNTRDIEVQLATSTRTDLKAAAIGLAPDSTCAVTTSPSKSLSSTGSASCTDIFGGAAYTPTTGLTIQSVANAETVTVTLTNVVSVGTPNGTLNEMSFNIYSTALVGGLTALNDAASDDATSVVYNLVYGKTLSITKEKVSDSSKYGANTRFTSIPAAYTDSIFAIVVDNSAQTVFNGVNVKDELDATAQGFFNGCYISNAEVVRSNTAIVGSPAVATTYGAAITGTYSGTLSGLVVPAASSSQDGRIVFYVGCDRNNNALGSSVSYNTASVQGFNNSSDADVTYSLPSELTAQALISGTGNLKITKTLVSKSTSTIGSGTDATYQIRVANTSSRDADNVLVTDVIQVPNGALVQTGTAPVGGDISNPFQSGSTTVRVVDTGNGVLGLASAYPQNVGGAGTIGNSARVFQITKLKGGEAFQFSYTVKYAGIFNTTCLVTDPAPITRNTAVLARTGSVNNGDVVSGTINDLTINAVTSFIKYDTAATNPLSVSNNVLYSDTDTSDNAAFIDSSADVCEPDMQILDIKKTGPDSNSSQAVLGQKTEYTIRYRNYAAKVQGSNNVRSSAKGLVLTLTLPDAATFDPTLPNGVTSSVAGQTVTLSGLPDIGLGDDTTKSIMVYVVNPSGADKAGTESKLIARLASSKELSGYNIDQREKSNTLIADQITDQGSPTTYSSNDSRGNNSAQKTLTLKGGPDVQVTKTVDIGVGALKMDTTTLTYTVKVKNIGTETANSVMVRDTLPTCTTFDSKVSGPNGTLTTDSKNIDYNLGNLNVDQEVVAVFKVKINQNDACKINDSTVIQNTATATISSSQTDLNVTNNTGIANSSVKAINQNAALTKSVDQLVAQPGATLTYTITLKGDGAKFTGTLVDELPAGVTFVSADPAAVRDGAKLTWSNVSVDSGKSLVATVKVTANSDATGTIVNKVTATTNDGKINFAQAVTSIEVAGNAKVTGYIFFDANKNSKEDKLERSATYEEVLGNVRVVAVASNGKEYSAVTDKTGAFMIEKLPAGKYTVRVDINTVKATYKNIAVNVAAVGQSNDGLTKVAEVRANESFDLVAGFRLFTNQTSTGATSNGVTTVSGIIAMLSFSFLATLAYAEARKRALSL